MSAMRLLCFYFDLASTLYELRDSLFLSLPPSLPPTPFLFKFIHSLI